jgi:hypothetical protein
MPPSFDFTGLRTAYRLIQRASDIDFQSYFQQELKEDGKQR